MKRVAAGDMAAFEILYDAYHSLVYSIALRITGKKETSEDVTQAVFVKIWTAPQTYQATAPVAAWLSRVARNRALDSIRRLRPEMELTLAVAVGASVDEAVFARLDAERVRTALGVLPHEQRSAIDLAFFDGMTHSEIAEHTSLPIGTIKTRIRSGLQKLRTSFEMSA